MNKRFQITRRSFISRCTAVAATTGLPLWFVERELAAMAQDAVPGPTSANDRPGIALVGCGGMEVHEERQDAGQVFRIPQGDGTGRCAYHCAGDAGPLAYAGEPGGDQ